MFSNCSQECTSKKFEEWCYPCTEKTAVNCAIWHRLAHCKQDYLSFVHTEKYTTPFEKQGTDTRHRSLNNFQRFDNVQKYVKVRHKLQ